MVDQTVHLLVDRRQREKNHQEAIRDEIYPSKTCPNDLLPPTRPYQVMAHLAMNSSVDGMRVLMI
jgi:hypothetical protein